MRLICLAFLACIASIPQIGNAQKVGEWSFNKAIPGVQIASTSNGQGSATGVTCFLSSKQCHAYVSMDNINCEVGRTYSMMINSSVGSFQINTTCTLVADIKLQIAAEFDSMKLAFESGSDIGFAIPMSGGQFRVVRFSTAGATATIKAAMQPPKASPVKPRDETI